MRNYIPEEGANFNMIGKELKKLGRSELIDIIYQLKKNEQEKQEQIAAMEEALMEKRIRISVAGSIAEAATDITQIFSVAQRTADLYLREIASMKEATEKECAAMVKEAERKAEEILFRSEQQMAELNACYTAEYKKYQQLSAEIQRLEEIKTKR